jgi:hypothetical protein
MVSNIMKYNKLKLFTISQTINFVVLLKEKLTKMEFRILYLF